MHERVATVGQSVPDDFEELSVVPVANVLQTSDGDDAIERPRDIAVVLDAQLHRQPDGPRRPERRLLAGERDACHRRSIALGRESGESAPSAADVEHAHAWRERELSADQIELRLLRLLERLRSAAPVGTGVRHVLRVEHRFEEIVAEIVVRRHVRSHPVGATAC